MTIVHHTIGGYVSIIFTLSTLIVKSFIPKTLSYGGTFFNGSVPAMAKCAREDGMCQSLVLVGIADPL